MGKIVEYVHWPGYAPVKVDEDLKGKHRAFCLCQRPCKRFKPNPNEGTTDKDCARSQELYEYCAKWGMTTLVWECPGFEYDQPTGGESHG